MFLIKLQEMITAAPRALNLRQVCLAIVAAITMMLFFTNEFL